MVLQAFGALSSGAIRGLARNLFPGFYERGLSGNQALKELQEAGLGYRRSDFFNDFKTGESRYAQETKARFVREDAIPSERILSPEYHGVPDKYSFVFRASGFNSETGETTDQYFYYHRGSLDTRENMESDAEDWIKGQSDRYFIDITSVSLVEGYINPIWS